MLTQNVVDLTGKIVDKIDLDQDIFGKSLCEDILHRMVQWQLSKKRLGTHHTKGISEISGTTKKPYSQKGTGRARQGSMRSAQFRGGAVIFGPVVRSHEYKLTKKFKKLALKIALSAKLAESNIIIVNDMNLSDDKTRNFVYSMSQLNLINSSVLIIDGKSVNDNIKHACRNLYKVDVLPQIGANVYDIINHKTVILTVEAINLLQERLKND